MKALPLQSDNVLIQKRSADPEDLTQSLKSRLFGEIRSHWEDVLEGTKDPVALILSGIKKTDIHGE